MLVLGIESSCDETAAAIVEDGRKVLSDVVVSQLDVHRDYGGVVPELASRKHIEAISVVIEQALLQAGIGVDRIEGIAVTRGPGLIGSLLVGIAAAKGMALALGLPICGVNHVHGHLWAIFLERHDLVYPFIGLVVSGGHTTIYKVDGPLDVEILGKTRDDAAGEAFDKVSKLLGMGYPGGPAIEKQAVGVTGSHIRLPRALMKGDSLDFSFSGLKSAVLRHAETRFGRQTRNDVPGSFHPLVPEQVTEEVRHELRELAAAFQDAVVDVLAAKAFRAALLHGCERLVICGGVAANNALRTRMNEEGNRLGIEPLFPSIKLCTDNAAMIAARGDMLLSRNLADDLDFDARSRW